MNSIVKAPIDKRSVLRRHPFVLCMLAVFGLNFHALFNWRKIIRSAPRRFVTLGLMLVVVLSINTSVVYAKSYPKEEVRAAFLFNFLKFVEWPAATFAEDGSPFRICMFGDIGSKKIFNKLSQQEAKSRGIEIDYSGVDNSSIPSPESLTACHIVYLGFMQTEMSKQVLEAASNQPILTVSIIDSFIENGGMITLVTQGKKNVLQINLTAAQSADLKISANMLDVAQIIEP